MNVEQWIAKVEKTKSALRYLIEHYHPINLNKWHDTDIMSPSITAPNAERACEVVREQIRKESMNNPEIQFDIALTKQDHATISSLLSSAWFGVPESTECWKIRGFAEACDLLDDPVEEY